MRSLVSRTLSFFGLQIKKINSGLWDYDQEFLRQYEKIRNKTLVKLDRSYVLYQFAKSQAKLSKADVAQVGVYQGGTAKMIAECFANSNNKIYLFDTFQGLPQSSEEDGLKRNQNDKVREFTDVDFNEVTEYFSDLSNVEFRKGFFPDTTKGLEDRQFCFVYLDADIYKSIKDGLEFFYPRMVPGGVIIIDDYATEVWPGVEKAVQEFCVKNDISPIKTVWWQGLILKGDSK